jgi:uncharacterized repeat protein (TIGR01451 family)
LIALIASKPEGDKDMKNRSSSTILCSICNLRKTRFIAMLACFAMLILMMMMAGAPFSRAQTSESIGTFATNCATPKTIFNLGDTVCAVADNPLLGPSVQRRFEWVTPDGNIFQLGPDIISDPQNDSITGALAQVGSWTVKTVNSSNNGVAVAKFVVLDPNNAATDLWTPIFAPFQVSAGSSAPFTVYVTNKGPNDAQNVQLTVTVATNSTFVSETQTSGPAFTCTNPTPGGTGSSICTLATLPANTTAVLQFIFQVDSAAAEGAGVSSTATVLSTTSELFVTDNTFTATATITAQTCEITCPPDITTDKTAGQCGTVVNYSTPTGAGTNCGTVVCSPASGSFFPTGTTNVICSGDTGGPCSFAVKVQDPQAPTITCPANITTNESSSGIGFAVVNYPAPTLNDNCPAPVSACSPPSGSSFPLGTTTVTCETDDGGSNTVNCTFTVTVNSLVCILNCRDDMVINENPAGSGAAVVNYSTPTATGCLDLATITCSPPSGSSFLLGSTAVNCSAKDASNNTLATCSFAVTVTIANCALSCPDDISTPNTPNQCGAVVAYSPPTTSSACGTVTCAPASGSFFPIGTSTVTCTPQNGTACSFTVTVQDVQPPAITCPANIVVTLPLNSTATTKAVSYSVTATDNCPGVTVESTPASGSTFPLGTTTVTATATDVAGNTSTCSFTVAVHYNFTGFFSPINNLPVVNVVNAGRSIPVKFSLSGNKGLNIFAPGSPASGVITCDTNAPPIEVIETGTAGNSSLSYDASSDQYHYVWKTERAWAGTCRQLQVQLNDGSVYVANFKFR